jgi:hypothetical protein
MPRPRMLTQQASYPERQSSRLRSPRPNHLVDELRWRGSPGRRPPTRPGYRLWSGLCRASITFGTGDRLVASWAAAALARRHSLAKARSCRQGRFCREAASE